MVYGSEDRHLSVTRSFLLKDVETSNCRGFKAREKRNYWALKDAVKVMEVDMCYALMTNNHNQDVSKWMWLEFDTLGNQLLIAYDNSKDNTGIQFFSLVLRGTYFF